MKFKALSNFYSDALLSHYCKGLYYTIRPGNDVLSREAEQWAKDGMIQFVDERPVGAVMSGKGKVTSWQ
jgi:hypothetical protein